MKNTWKRTIAILLSVLLAFAALPMAFAAGGSAGTSVNYDIDSSGNLKVTGTGPMASYANAAAAPWASQVASIKSVYISSGVTTVGAYAFSGCTALIDVSLPAGLVKIEASAFENCTNLKSSVSIPNTVTEIGANAFAGCNNLEAVSVLNPSCTIASPTTFPQNAMIYCYANSTAETYAKTNGRKYSTLNSGTQQVENNPAAVSGNGNTAGSLDQILKTIMNYVQPLWTMFKNLFTSLLANAGNANAGTNTSTTGGTGTTGTAANPSSAGNMMNILSGIFSSFGSFVSNTLNSMNAAQNTGTQGTTASTGTTAAANDSTANAAAGFLNLITGLFSGVQNAAASATTTTTAKK